MGATGLQGDLAESEGRGFSARGAGWAFAAEATRPGQEAESVRFVPRPEGEAGWTTARSPEGLRFGRQYLHPIFQLHPPSRNPVLRLAGGRGLKNQNKPFPHT